MSTIHVAFAVNEAYLPYCAVTITSICQHLPASEKINFYILHSGSLSEAKRDEFFAKTPGLENCQVEFVAIKDHLGIAKQVSTSAYISAETYFRLYIHEILPNIDKILYLDSDIVVEHNIRELFDFDISDCCIAGVEDITSYAFMRKLKLPETSKYVNGGVILMNLANLRKLDLGSKIQKIINSPARQLISAGDQDLMALVFQNQIKYLPLNWNVPLQTTNEIKSRCEVTNGTTLNDMLQARSKHFLIHYIGLNKPWQGASSEEYICLWQFQRWFRYAAKTAYYTAEHQRIESENRQKLRKLWIRKRLPSLFRCLDFLDKLRKLPGVIKFLIIDVKNSLNLMQNNLQHTQIVLKNAMLSLNAEKRKNHDFLPEILYKIPNRKVSTFEDNEHIQHVGFKDTYHVLFATENIHTIKNNTDINRSDFSVLQFYRDNFRDHQQAWALQQSSSGIVPTYFIESSFITSIFSFTKDKWPMKFKRFYSFLVDDMSFYFDAQQPGRIALYLNSADSHLDSEQMERCRWLIRFIVENQLTKYNFQPLRELKIFNQSDPKVLVLDQTAGDASILRGGANADSFERMLRAAIDENPGASIYIKTHPDTVTRAIKCYYSDINEPGVINLTDAINPYSILKYVDKVYVCTSQFGFEALMAGKKVITFGQPIYAGWGLTDDRVPNPQRSNTLTLEELFFALYIKFAIHIHPYTLSICSIEDYLPAMLKLRSEYFESQKQQGSSLF